jgi:hypothetical protein
MIFNFDIVNPEMVKKKKKKKKGKKKLDMEIIWPTNGRVQI